MPKGQKFSQYPLLNDRDWLYQKYIVERLSTIELARLSGAKTANSARQALIRSDIEPRTISQGLTTKRESNELALNIPVLTGCLLGDGYLTIWNRHSENSNPAFYKRNKYKDHIEFIAQQLYPATWESRVKHLVEQFQGKPYELYSFRSLTHKELLPLYRNWYPNGIKVVPEDIQITPEVLLHWFLDDGWSRLRNRGYHEVVIGLETQCFSKANVEHLCQLLTTELDLKFRPTVYKSRTTGEIQWRMQLPQKQAQYFFQVIGSCPVLSLSYKWK